MNISARPDARELANVPAVIRFGAVAWQDWVVGALVPLVAACAELRPVDKPMAPDMSTVVAAYDAPTGALTSANIRSVVEAANARIDSLHEIGISEEVIEAWRAAIEGLDEEEVTNTESATERVRNVRQHALVFRQGYLRGVRICDGWGPEPVPNIEENGFILLLAGFDSVGFDSVLWGGFFRCRYLVRGLRIELGGLAADHYGIFKAYVGEDVSFRDVFNGLVFYRFDLLSTIEDEPVPMTFDFRIDRVSEIVATRIEVPEGGYVIPSVGRDVVGVRATNGDFVCSASSSSCTNSTEVLPY